MIITPTPQKKKQKKNQNYFISSEKKKKPKTKNLDLQIVQNNLDIIKTDKSYLQHILQSKQYRPSELLLKQFEQDINTSLLGSNVQDKRAVGSFIGITVIGVLGFLASGLNPIGLIAGAIAGGFIGQYAGRKIKKKLITNKKLLQNDLFQLKLKCLIQFGYESMKIYKNDLNTYRFFVEKIIQELKIIIFQKYFRVQFQKGLIKVQKKAILLFEKEYCLKTLRLSYKLTKIIIFSKEKFTQQDEMELLDIYLNVLSPLLLILNENYSILSHQMQIFRFKMEKLLKNYKILQILDKQELFINLEKQIQIQQIQELDKQLDKQIDIKAFERLFNTEQFKNLMENEQNKDNQQKDSNENDSKNEKQGRLIDLYINIIEQEEQKIKIEEENNNNIDEKISQNSRQNAVYFSKKKIFQPKDTIIEKRNTQQQAVFSDQVPKKNIDNDSVKSPISSKFQKKPEKQTVKDDLENKEDIQIEIKKSISKRKIEDSKISEDNGTNIFLKLVTLVQQNPEDSKHQWEKVMKKGETVGIYTKMTPGNACVLVRCEAYVENCTSEEVFIQIYNAKIRSQWDKVTQGFQVLDTISEGVDVIYFFVDPGLGVTKRDFVQQRILKRDYPEKGQITIAFFSIQHSSQPEKKGFIRAHSYIAGYVIRPVGQHTQLTIMTQSDVKGVVPKYVVNYMAARQPPKWVESMQKGCQDYRKQYQKK
ncbi:start domain protein [Ichthyophthirius multifiliis]|uniref:Start domain protein n=1 Tax=Ichthyophthirius multifiliis TaxID=5932 RepID=G0R0V9_ICHMU|nr:start domain protein [Ichthyophthirius multifiliis]EGR28919.1 start domain protein [Ichthyophthirius multifiliis]|eukprot:XP_004030155.1 start domain protein [Ichthyophthirius multifiliis]